MPPSNAINANQLNLTQEQLNLLHQGHATVANRAGGSSSSRAASRASSQGPLMLDLRTLQSLEIYFNRVMEHIETRINNLSMQSYQASRTTAELAALSAEEADAEISRFKYLNKQLDDLELEFETNTNLCEIVKQNRQQLEELDREFEHEAAYEQAQEQGRSHGSSSHHSSSRRREGHRDRTSGRSHRR